MNIEQMTQKTRDALQAAQRIAVEYSNNAVEQEHLLAALAQQQAERQRGKQQNAEDHKRNDLTLLAHMHPPLIRPAAAQASCAAARKLKK